MKYLDDLNLNFNQLLNALQEQLVTDPVSPVEGQFWYNTTEKRSKYYDGVSVRSVATLDDVEGLLDFKGGYDASTNTPNLETPTAGAVLKGDSYVVTVAGDFFTEAVQVGDMLIAKNDDPSTLNEWVRVESNQPVGSTKFAVDLDAAEGTVTKAVATGKTTYTVTHSLGSTDVDIEVYEVATGEKVFPTVKFVDANNVDVIIKGNVTDGDYRVVVFA